MTPSQIVDRLAILGARFERDGSVFAPRGRVPDEVRQALASDDVRVRVRQVVVARVGMRHEPDWHERLASWPEGLQDAARRRADELERVCGVPRPEAEWFAYVALRGWDAPARKETPQ